MKLVTSPQKLSSIFDSSMLIRHAKPLISPVTLYLTKDGITVKESYSDIIAVYCTFAKSYFDKYESDDEELVLTPDLVQSLSSFKEDTLTLSITKDKLILQDSCNKYETELEVNPNHKFPFEMKKADFLGKDKKSYSGYYPHIIDPKSSIILSSSELALPSNEALSFTLKKKKLSVQIKSKGTLTHDFTTKATPNDADTTINVDGEYFLTISKPLANDVYIILDEKGIVLSEVSDTYSKTYILSTLI